VIEEILSKLEKVKRTGRNNWLACCPAHDDRNPSLTIHAADDGRILVRCFAECSFEEIVGAVGLGWEPWFPPKQPDDFKRAVRRPYPAADVLEALTDEALIVMVSASCLRQGGKLTDVGHERLLTAMQRISAGREIALGERR
jgi:hypothetical protein